MLLSVLPPMRRPLFEVLKGSCSVQTLRQSDVPAVWTSRKKILHQDNLLKVCGSRRVTHLFFIFYNIIRSMILDTRKKAHTPSARHRRKIRTMSMRLLDEGNTTLDPSAKVKQLGPSYLRRKSCST